MKNVLHKLLISGIPYKTKYGGIGYSSVSLLTDGDCRILFDVGHYAVREEIIKIIEKYRINVVFLSHLHYDHCLNIDLFINRGIKIYLNKKEWEYLKNINDNDVHTFKFFNKIIKAKDIILFDEEFNITENIKAIETIGHTSGHSSLCFTKGKKKYILAGDAIKTYSDFKNPLQADITPYNLKQFISSKQYIVNNFDVIVPGHSGVIEGGVCEQKKPILEMI